MGFFKNLIKSSSSSAGTGASNIVKKKLRKRGFGFHYMRAGDRRLPTYKKYEPMVKLLRDRNNELVEIEKKFGDVEGIMPEIEELYRRAGPYVDPEANESTEDGLIKFEQSKCNGGTKYTDEEAERINGDLKDPYKNSKFEVKPITINGKLFLFEIPPKRPIYFERDDRYEYVSYFGYGETEPWADRYSQFINLICDHAKTLHTGNDDKEKYIDIVREEYINKIKILFRAQSGDKEGGKTEPGGGEQNVGGKEKHFHTGYMRTIHDDFVANYSTLRKKLMERIPQSVRYKHTYKIALPVRKHYDGEVKEKLDPYVTPVVDDRGMPWEVADDGELMVIKWKRKYPRAKGLPDASNMPTQHKKVPKSMIKELDLLKVANYVVNQWDEYRDDWRDARYHPETLTITDNLMANHWAAGDEWDLKDETKMKTDDNDRSNDDRRFTMHLHDGSRINGLRKTSDINPSFDLRAFEPEKKGIIGQMKSGKEWQYVGKWRYYGDYSDICVEDQKDPAVTTRGMSMFLIDKVISEGKSYKEMHDELKFIGSSSRFDYGPRAYDKGIKTFTEDPFNLDVSSANESSKEYKPGDGD